LATLTLKGEIIIPNVDKQINKLKSFSKSHFEDFNVGKIINLANFNCTSEIDKFSNTILIIFEEDLLLFNPQNGSFASKSIKINGVIDSELIEVFTCGVSMTIKVDNYTISKYKYRDKSKSKKKSFGNFDFQFKKRFSNKISAISNTPDNQTVILESNGNMSVIKFENDVKKIKVVNTNSEKVTPTKKLRQNKKPQQSLILLAAQTLTNFVISYGQDFNKQNFESFDLLDLITKHENQSEILLKRDPTTNLQNSKENIPGWVKSSTNVNFEQLSGNKRKISKFDDKIQTIGDTLEERLQDGLKISENKDVIDPNDKSITLAMAIHANNEHEVLEVLKSSLENEQIIKSSVKSFSKEFIPSILNLLAKFIKTDPQTASISLEWLNEFLKTFPNYILSESSKSCSSLTKIHNLAEEKRRYSNLLNKLNGKINYFLNTPINNQTTMISQLSNTTTSIKPQFIYEADNDNSSISSEESEILEEPESENEMSDFDDDIMEDEMDILKSKKFSDLDENGNTRKTKFENLSSPESSDENEGFYPIST